MNIPKVTRLANHMRVTTDTMSFESAVVMVIVKTGSRNENEKNNGISHFLEHMAFKGTVKRTAFQIAEEIDYIGGSMNAFTSKEVTAYYIKVLKKDIEKAIEVLADIIQNSVFGDTEVANEKNVILQELAMTQDTPDDIIFDKFAEVAYKGDKIGRPIVGAKENIENMQRQDFIDYMDTYYYGGNMVLGVCGDIEHNKVVELANKYFSNIKSKEGSINYDKANYQGGLYFEHKKDLEQVQFVLGFKAFSYNEDEYYYPQSILSDILGGGSSSRLYQEVREKKGLAYTVTSYSSCYFDTGMLGVYAAVSPDKIDELVTVLIKEIRHLGDTLTDKELEKVKNQYKASILMSSESSYGRAQKAVNNLLMYNRYITSEEKVEQINKVSIAKLQEIIKVILNNGKPSLAIYGNVSEGQKYYDLILNQLGR